MEEFAEHMIADADDEGRIIAASVICIGCKKEIPESKKREMINTGRWVPTTVPSRPNIRSYHIPTAISLMMSWTDLYLEFDKVLKYEGRDEATPRSFTNLYLGLPFKESGTRPKIDNPSDRVGDYDRGTIPEGVIYLTMAVDVQPGKKNPRLEMEILGVGLGYRTWSIDYKIFEGSVDHPEDGAWVDFHNWIMNESQFTDQWGRKFRPVIGFVDAGDGNMMETVYQFCAAHKGLFPSKGQQTIRASHEKKDSGDDPLRNEMKYGFTRIGQSDRFLYRISTNHYKRIIYANLQVERVEGDGAQRAHFCDFPREYGQEYFDGLLSEELRADGAYYKIHTRNEPLDCRVYSLAASDVWLDDQVRRAQEAWKKQHPETTKDDLMKINGWQALEHLKRILDSQIVSRR
jgi:phage terminase large subunit GpA-like protein